MGATVELTDTTRCKSRLGIDAAETLHDGRLGDLIAEVSQEFEDKCSRFVKELERTEYASGDGTARLMLRHGPLVSVASVYYVEYQEDEASPGDLEEVLTEVEAYEFLLEGLRSEGDIGPGYLYRRGGSWTAGVRNYKVTYTGGFGTTTAALPDTLKGLATSEVAVRFLNREAEGLISKTIGDGALNPAPAKNRAAAWERALRPYKIPGGT